MKLVLNKVQTRTSTVLVCYNTNQWEQVLKFTESLGYYWYDSDDEKFALENNQPLGIPSFEIYPQGIYIGSKHKLLEWSYIEYYKDNNYTLIDFNKYIRKYKLNKIYNDR